MAGSHQIRIPSIPDIPDEQRSPIVDQLIDICSLQQEMILSLQEQVQILTQVRAHLGQNGLNVAISHGHM
jgi:hypothetical protein